MMKRDILMYRLAHSTCTSECIIGSAEIGYGFRSKIPGKPQLDRSTASWVVDSRICNLYNE